MRSLILQTNEEVVAMFRQSPAVLFQPLFLAAIGILLPTWYAVHYALFGSFWVWILFWFLFVVLWFFEKTFRWRREKYIVTTVRFVKTTHEHVFRQVVSESNLDRILNISFRTTGPWSVLAGFGDIDLQVVGKLEPIVIKSIQRPALVKEFLWRLHEKAEELRPAGSSRQEFAKPNQPLP